MADRLAEIEAVRQFSRATQAYSKGGGLTLREFSDSDSEDERAAMPPPPPRYRDLVGLVLSGDAPEAMLNAWLRVGIQCMTNDPRNGVVAEGFAAVLSLHTDPQRALQAAEPRWGRVSGKGHPDALLLKRYVALALLFCEDGLIQAVVDAGHGRGALAEWAAQWPRRAPTEQVEPDAAARSKIHHFLCVFRDDWNQHLVRLSPPHLAAQAPEVREVLEKAADLWRAEGWSRTFARRDDSYEILMNQNKK